MWNWDQEQFLGRNFDVQVYSNDNSSNGILFVHHGESRSTYSSGSQVIAERDNLSVYSPIFPEADFSSREYQRGGITDSSGNVLPESEWTTRYEEPMMEWARSQYGEDTPVYLFGHSAGAQYLCRVAAYEGVPDYVEQIIIANPSTWVLPSLSEDAPYGFDGLGTPAEELAALEAYLALPITIYLGAEDSDPNDDSLATSDAAMRQGDNRLERGITTFEMGEQVAAQYGWEFNWQLVIADGVGHSGSDMLRAPEMQDALHPDDEPVNQAPDDITLSNGTVLEDADAGTVVGQLSAHDADGDRVSFTVIDDARFVVNSAGQLVTASGADLSGDGDRIETVTIRANDGHGGVTDTDVEVVIRDVPPPEDPDPIGEAGTVRVGQESAGQWHRVTFTEALENPSVIMGGLTSDGPHPATLRVRNVTDTGFEFQLDEWDYLDGKHVVESVSWIAVERGTHHLSNGLTIQAGSSSGSGGARGIDFADGLFSDAPTVVAQVASTNDASAVMDRVYNIDRTGFDLRLDQQENNPRGAHPAERVD